MGRCELCRGQAPKGYKLTTVTQPSIGGEFLAGGEPSCSGPRGGPLPGGRAHKTMQEVRPGRRLQPFPNSPRPQILLGFDTHCWSFPYSLSKSLSTCKRERELNHRRNDNGLEKICQPLDTPSTPSPGLQEQHHPAHAGTSRSLMT